MRILISIFCLAFAITAYENTGDYVLRAYKLTPIEESQFASNSLVSSFWQVWDSVNGDYTHVVYDYVDLTPASNGWVDGANSFSGEKDASVIMRAAYGENGLYLYFGIIDNVWQPPAGYDADGVDFLLDMNSSEVIRNANPFDLYIQPSWGWTLTYYTVQYQVNVGTVNGLLASYMMINYFSGSAMMYNRTNMSDLDKAYAGLSLHQTPVDEHHRVLEMHIPWSWVGCSGGVGTMPVIGRMVAFDPRYNDSDAATQTGKKFIGWKPWDRFNSTGWECSNYSYPQDICDTWCDIQFGPSLDDPTRISPRKRIAAVNHPTLTNQPRTYDLLGRSTPADINKKAGLSKKAGMHARLLLGGL